MNAGRHRLWDMTGRLATVAAFAFLGWATAGLAGLAFLAATALAVRWGNRIASLRRKAA